MRHHYKAGLVGALAVALFVLSGASTPAVPAEEIAGKELKIPARERAVRVVYFRAAGDAPRPAALLLHGAGGFGRYLANFSRYGAALANEGIDAYLVSYYSSADEDAAGSVFAERYEAWAKLVDDVADHVLTQAESNGKVGLVGFSNGGILATGAGALDPKIAAAVIYYGTEPWPLRKPPTRFPPMLILHGDADTIIPVEEGQRLAKMAEILGTPAELVIYPGEKHGFGIRNTGPNDADSFMRTVVFLKKHLLPKQ